MDKRKWIGKNHLTVPFNGRFGVNGKCLPKDVDSLLKLVNPHSGILLKAIRESNKKYISHT